MKIADIPLNTQYLVLSDKSIHYGGAYDDSRLDYIDVESFSSLETLTKYIEQSGQQPYKVFRVSPVTVECKFVIKVSQ